MCRSIRPLHNYEPASTHEDVEAAALQFVRKISGMTKPAKVNEEAFDRAVAAVTEASARLLDQLVATAPPRDRAREIERARERAAKRFPVFRLSAARFETLTPHVDRFTPDDRSDRPTLGAIHGDRATLLVEGGASVAHLRSFVDELEARGRPPVEAIVLTHWHWDHSFGSAAVDVPVYAHPDSRAELAVQAGYDWSDAALDARVRQGLELQFCADMIRVELSDRSDLRIVVPSEAVEFSYTIDLGGATAIAKHVGGDHAPDSLAVYAVEDRVLFLGDCLYQKLHAPEEQLTIAGVRNLLDALAEFDVAVAVEGHDDDVADAAAYAARIAELRRAADLVERRGADAPQEAGDDESLAELVGFLLAGERAAGRSG